MEQTNQTKKPIVSYHVGNDPTQNMSWVNSLTDINIITTKKLTNEFVKVAVQNKHRMFLHVEISGMGKTQLEPNIPSVKEMFHFLKELVRLGFPTKQILIIIKPIIPNDNGLRALELLLKVFTEYRDLRLRHLKIEVLSYYKIDKNYDASKNGKFASAGDVVPMYTSNKTDMGHNQQYAIANRNIAKRVQPFRHIIHRTDTFYFAYKVLLRKYETIINIDNISPIIGVRELMPFGYNNNWNGEKLIPFKDGKPIVNNFRLNPVRCNNRCILCPFKQ